MGMHGHWIGIEALAEHLDVPVRTIRTWRAKRTGPQPRKFGRHLRWNVDDVAAWANGQTADRDQQG